jgi:hypothetical protein
MDRFVRLLPCLPLIGIAFLIAASVTGCGGATDTLPREAISGTVTLDGQALPKGVLQIVPAKQNEGTPCGSLIQDGKFAIARAQGPVPGEYVVMINSNEGGSEASGAPAGAPGPVATADRPKELIPAEYNTSSKLTAQVKAGGPNTFEFALKSK